ncbi:MAG: hypothetical protein H6818_17500 [Phycisphaerales bacterium]|nr:hypothetical protein [Phycisphaerales bacterium]MCB9864575.1 hypothetical protein [Phycisphaerales bacterium]
MNMSASWHFNVRRTWMGERIIGNGFPEWLDERLNMNPPAVRDHFFRMSATTGCFQSLRIACFASVGTPHSRLDYCTPVDRGFPKSRGAAPLASR